MDKNAFRQLSYGVYVISTWDNGRPTGCTANSAMQITSEPVTIAISINHSNYTNQCIKENGHFAISILGENSDPGIIGTFGFRSGRDCNKFDDVKMAVKGFMPVVADACACICCEVIDTMETSTHTVFLGKVTDADVLKKEKFGCHPCINTSSLCFDTKDLLEKLIPAMGHEPIMVDLP